MPDRNSGDFAGFMRFLEREPAWGHGDGSKFKANGTMPCKQVQLQNIAWHGTNFVDIAGLVPYHSYVCSQNFGDNFEARYVLVCSAEACFQNLGQ